MASEHDIENLFTCATNEGALYRRWCIMGRGYMNTPDSGWCDDLRPYARQLVREGRAERSTLNAATIIAAAARVRDYYIAHVKELGE